MTERLRKNLHAAIGRQLFHPCGTPGRILGAAMRWLNAAPYGLAIDALDVEPADRVLELGCGPGYGVNLLSARTFLGAVYAIDHSATMLAQARSANRKPLASGRALLCQAEFAELPFASRSMDKALAVNVAYFWQDAERIVGELRRVLRPGGMLAVYVTGAETMRRWKFAPPETHRLFDADDLVRTVASGGFPGDRITVTRVRVFPRTLGLIATVRN